MPGRVAAASSGERSIRSPAAETTAPVSSGARQPHRFALQSWGTRTRTWTTGTKNRRAANYPTPHEQQLPAEGSNLESPDPESGALPITPTGTTWAPTRAREPSPGIEPGILPIPRARPTTRPRRREGPGPTGPRGTGTNKYRYPTPRRCVPDSAAQSPSPESNRPPFAYEANALPNELDGRTNTPKLLGFATTGMRPR